MLRSPSTDADGYMRELTQALTECGAVLLLTGSPAAYWTLRDSLHRPSLNGVATADGDWAAWLPLRSRITDRAKAPPAPPSLGRRLLRRLVS